MFLKKGQTEHKDGELFIGTQGKAMRRLFLSREKILATYSINKALVSYTQISLKRITEKWQSK